MNKIGYFCFTIFFLFTSSIFTESTKTFLNIPFGTNRIEVCSLMLNNGWKIEDSKEKEIIFYGGDLNYESFVLFDKITFYFTEYGKFYYTRFILLDKNKSIENLENYAKEIIKINKLNFATNENNKNVYLSKEGELFSYQIQSSEDIPFLLIEKGNPLTLANESRFESFDPRKGIFLQSGNGRDFYYIVCDNPYIDGNIVYLSKSKKFDTVVYLFFYPDPDGIKLANYIDKNQSIILLTDLIEKYEISPYRVKWCTKLLFCE